MNEKLDLVLEKIGNLFDKWITEFETNPVRTTLKVCLIIYCIKLAKKHLR